MRLEMLVGVERFVAAFMLAAIRLGTWGSVSFADVGPELVVLGECLVAVVLCAGKGFGSVVPVLMCF